MSEGRRTDPLQHNTGDSPPAVGRFNQLDHRGPSGWLAVGRTTERPGRRGVRQRAPRSAAPQTATRRPRRGRNESGRGRLGQANVLQELVGGGGGAAGRRKAALWATAAARAAEERSRRRGPEGKAKARSAGAWTHAAVTCRLPLPLPPPRLPLPLTRLALPLPTAPLGRGGRGPWPVIGKPSGTQVGKGQAHDPYTEVVPVGGHMEHEAVTLSPGRFQRRLQIRKFCGRYD